MSIGVIVRVEHAQKMPDGTPAVVIRGIERARVGAAVAGDGDGLWVEVQPIDGQDADADAFDRLQTVQPQDLNMPQRKR